MNNSFVEIKSTLWQKIFMTLLVLPFEVLGVVTCFQTQLHAQEIALLLCWFLGWSAPWWAVMRYSIRADKNGICQTNGFRRQSIRWDEVTAYYMQLNAQYNRNCVELFEPVMLDSQGKIIFQGFHRIMGHPQKVTEQHRRFWQFVEEQLQDKPRKEPPSDLDKLVRESMTINWAEKSRLWKIGYFSMLLLYILFWLSVGMASLYFLLKINMMPKKAISAAQLIMFAGVFFHIFIKFKIRKRKIAEELRKNQR